MSDTEDVDSFHFLATFLKLILSRSERIRAFWGVVIECDFHGIFVVVDTEARVFGSFCNRPRNQQPLILQFRPAKITFFFYYAQVSYLVSQW